MKTKLMLAAVLLSAALCAHEEAKAEGKHGITSYVTYRNHQDDYLTCKQRIFGIAYKYTKPTGFNAKVGMSLFQLGGKQDNGELFLEGNYKFATNYFGLVIHPFTKFHIQHFGFGADMYGRTSKLQSGRGALGLGAEKEVYKGVSVGINASVSRDVYKYFVYENIVGDLIAYKQDNLNGYEFSMPISFKITENGTLELEPMYASAFDSSYTQKKAQVSFHYAF